MYYRRPSKQCCQVRLSRCVTVKHRKIVHPNELWSPLQNQLNASTIPWPCWHGSQRTNHRRCSLALSKVDTMLNRDVFLPNKCRKGKFRILRASFEKALWIRVSIKNIIHESYLALCFFMFVYLEDLAVKGLHRNMSACQSNFLDQYTF